MSLSLRDLRFAWPDGPAVLDGITLDVPSGSRIAVIGGNGAGKSTLARCIAGLVAPETPGSILWHGRPIRALCHAERVAQVQIVGQRPDLHLSGRASTVRAEVAFGPENLGISRSGIAMRVDSALDAMGLAALAHRDPRRLSGGETQRLAIASALALRPRLLILDEPVTELDREAREGLIARLARLDPDLTILVLDVAADTWRGQKFDTIWRLDGGRLSPLELSSAGRQVSRALPSAFGSPVLSVSDLSFAYDGSPPLLKGVSFEVPSGAAVAVTGRNGAGKSTLMRLIAGLNRPTAGQITVAGLNPAKVTPHRLAAVLGMVFQNADRQFVASTLLEEATLAPRLQGVADPAGAAGKALVDLGLGDMAGAHPLDLHNGARRLAAVAAAVAHSPQVLLLDETQRGLDADHRERLERLIHRRRSEGTTVLFVCHDTDFADRNATHRLAVTTAGVRFTPI